MKKVLALVLAVMMMATVAFAATSPEVENPIGGGTSNAAAGRLPGSTLKINDSGIVTADPTHYTLDESDTSKIYVKNINSTNYSISNIKYDDGKNLVESVKFNDKNDRVEIKLVKDYTSTKAKQLKMTFTLKGKKVGKGSKPKDIPVAIDFKINYALDDTSISITDTDTVVTPANFDDDSVIYKVAAPNTDKYGTMEFTAEDTDVEVEVRVYKDDELYLYNETDANDDILKAYADTDADLNFLTFKGDPTFNATATVRFYKEEDSYIYGVKDGKLTNVNAKWDDDEGCFILKTRTLGSYVFSDKKLSVSATTPDTQNPDTGANDVVGIAGALAAVALVSAAAVSLKK